MPALLWIGGYLHALKALVLPVLDGEKKRKFFIDEEDE